MTFCLAWGIRAQNLSGTLRKLTDIRLASGENAGCMFDFVKDIPRVSDLPCTARAKTLAGRHCSNRAVRRTNTGGGQTVDREGHCVPEEVRIGGGGSILTSVSNRPSHHVTLTVLTDYLKNSPI